MVRLIAGLVVTCIACVAPASADLFSVLSLDETRTGNSDEPGGPRYLTAPAMVDATNILLNDGFSIQTTDRFVSANFNSAHILYSGAVSVDFTQDEIDDTLAFVNAGGCLVLQRDWGDYYPAADALAAAFGVTYDTGPYGISMVPTSVIQTTASSIWSGPAGSVSAFAQVYSAGVIGADSIGEHASDPGVVAIAARNVGLGKVYFLTDMDAWDSVGDSVTPTPFNANGIVWANLFYSCVPEPTTALLLLAGAACLRRR